LIGHTLTQSVFHQDPRYFYKGTGSLRSRFLYAVGTAFVAKGDNGHWQPDYSDMIGGLAAREILSPLHSYTSRPGLRAFHGFLLGFSGRATDHLIQEFVYRWLTTHVPKTVARRQPVLRDGTPVPLFSVEDLRSATTGTARPVTFVLSKDLEAGGVIAAKAGTKVEGQVSSTAAPSATGAVDSMHLSVENVHQDRRDGSSAEKHAAESGHRCPGISLAGRHGPHRVGPVCRQGCNTRTGPVAPTGPPHAFRQSSEMATACLTQ
jgi:hypothetical protein